MPMANKLVERKVPLQSIKANEAKLKDISSMLQVQKLARHPPPHAATNSNRSSCRACVR
jgi:hypothetical protein